MTLAKNAPLSDDAAESAATPAAVEEEVERLRAENAVLLARVAELEARVEQQDAALRRVLTLLVDWVESDTAKPEYAPIRGVANWHDAA